MLQGYINYNSTNGYEKFLPYAYKSDDSLKLGGINSSQYVQVSNLNNIISKSQIYNFSLEIPMANTGSSWSGDLQYAKNDLGLTTFDLNYDILFCNYSITTTAVKSSSASSGAYIILTNSFLGKTVLNSKITDSQTFTSNYYYMCLRSGKDSYIAVIQNFDLIGYSLPSINMSTRNYNFSASVKITGEYYYIKF